MISGKKLKQIRLFRKLTQKELAIMSGLTDAAIVIINREIDFQT